MQVGDLVKIKATWSKAIGIIMRPETGGWWILWFCGTWGFHNQRDLEVICK